MEFNNREFMYRWIAGSDSLYLDASDPLSLIGLYMIRDEWAIKKKIPDYHEELIHGNRSK